MSVLGPAKIKAYLSGIKETYLDNSSAIDTLAGAFLGVLKIELVLRGVLVQDDEKLWDRIQSSVGKSLLVDQTSKIPKPLLAGANVMAGRVTEAFHTKLKTLISQQVGDGGSFDSLRDLVPAEPSQGARQRAEDLQDERWLFLLSSSFQPNYDSEIGIQNYANGVLQMAIGYYSTASSIQSDTPQMWKKLWDVWSLTDGSNPNDDRPPFEAQSAIENLIRIALAKGNTKRASDLQLRLVQSYLNPKRVSLVGILSVLPKKKRTDVADDTIARSFGESLTRDLPSNQGKSVEKAKITLEACESHFEGEKASPTIDPETILYQTLKVETFLAEENAKVEEEAREMENRSATQTTFADCAAKCRTKMIESSYNKSDKVFFQQAINLRDTMIEAWRSAATDANLRGMTNLNLCFEWVNQSILRLKERAEVISRKKLFFNHEPWNEVLQFILPILKEMDRRIADSDGPESRIPLAMKWLSEVSEENGEASATMKVIKNVVSILPTVLWMMLGDENKLVPPLDKELNLVVDILSGLIKWQKGIDSQQQRRDTPSVGTEDNASLKSMRKWQTSRACAVCFLCQDKNSSISQITNDAIVSSKKEKKRGFVALLQCLVAWSGWFENPWPYCTNLGDARRLLVSAESDLSRPLTFLEGVLLQLAKADAEFLNGGFVQEANQQYTDVLNKLQDEKCLVDSNSVVLLRAHCYNGMTRAQHAAQDYVDYNNAEKSFLRKSLEILEDLDLQSVVPSLWIWNTRPTFAASKAHQLSVTRQLIADSLVHFGQFEAARSFLEKGVADSPQDADAALALGAFNLRISFYLDTEQSADGRKKAQIHLLKAAKLDASRSNPFALLGIWFEATGDSKRAEGCFRKSLKLDPCNPIAGRGLLRLCSTSSCQDILDFAINQSSPLNGWAWNAVGLNKAYSEGDDSLAVVAILKGLRCRDIALPNKENLGVFYQTPSSLGNINELSSALAEVGMCYRRLGRMTASIRAFHASIDATETAPHATLVACAQVEQELGLFDEAAAKFSSVVERGESDSRSVALHGQAMALFSMAARELMDGKVGAAFTCIKRAIDSCENSTMVSGCQFKLLGDLYSFGASFPSDVFSDHERQAQDSDSCFQNQVDFVSKGEDAFRSALRAQAPSLAEADEEGIVIKSSALCDIALNMLLQAQLITSQQVHADEINNKYQQAADAFREAVDYNPVYAASWCGLGCSVLKIDPLLAQHAFCRCIQIENTFSDAYANVGFLYTSKFALNASRSTMEALTQVADTPMMWMNCAFILEREAGKYVGEDEGKRTEDFISQAADAYRASLQVDRNPEAQLGLSLTGRMQSSKDRQNDSVSSPLFTQSRKDCFSYMNEYIGASLRRIGTAPVFQGVMSIEVGESVPSYRTWKHDIFAKGKEAVKTIYTRQNNMEGSTNDRSFQKLRASTESLLEGKDRKEPETSLSTREGSLQRQIWFEPGRGDLWLLLAKVFIENDAIGSAKTAASRAVDILSQDLVASSQSNGKDVSFVDAEIISEATSLHYWLNALEVTPVPQYEVQRALMMDPTNLVARHSLRQKTQ